MSRTDVTLTGHRELVRQLRALGGPRMKAMARKVAKVAMGPIVNFAKANAPVDGGRLKASIGQIATTNRRKDAFSSRVGTRRDFVYRSTSGEKMVTGRGKVRDRALKKGYAQDRKTAQQYARVIEFGYDKKGRLRRKAGPSHFLDRAINQHRATIIGTVESEFRRYLATPV